VTRDVHGIPNENGNPTEMEIKHGIGTGRNGKPHQWERKLPALNSTQVYLKAVAERLTKMQCSAQTNMGIYSQRECCGKHIKLLVLVLGALVTCQMPMSSVSSLPTPVHAACKSVHAEH